MALSGGQDSAFPDNIPPRGLFAFCLLPVSSQCSVLPVLSLLCRLFLLHQLCPIFFVVIAWVSEGLRAGV